ncbi:MAG: hypothetical protein HQM12_10390, partial [SAR324 cluster bacterium]|nr:hypothetical protein [SAR324 cluster bacterium]
MEDFRQLIREIELSHCGIDTEYKYSHDNPLADEDFGKPNMLEPLLMSFAFVEAGGQENRRIFCCVIDLRDSNLRPSLAEMLKFPIPYVAHYAPAELMCLLKMGIPLPRQIWDTCICERALTLGNFHPQYDEKPNDSVPQEIENKAKNKKFKEQYYSLINTEKRYQLKHNFAAQKERLQKSFLGHPPGVNFSREQIDYAAEDALIVAKLYFHQILHASSKGLLHHLITIEMPWVVTMASIQFHGIRFDWNKYYKIVAQCKKVLPLLEQQIAAFEVKNHNSHDQLSDYFQEKNLLPHFLRNGKPCFDKENLKENANLDPLVPLLRAAKFVDTLIREKHFRRSLVENDEHIYPSHFQLGAATGRQTSTKPNVLGIGGILRPLVIPAPGFGLGEVDWSQIEVGIAA